MSQATKSARGRSAFHSRRTMLEKPMRMFAGPPSPRRNDFGQRVVRPVGERVAVHHQERSAHASDRSSSSTASRSRSVATARGLIRRKRQRDRRARSVHRMRRAAARAVPADRCRRSPAGTSGTPASSAIRAAPVRQRASCFFRKPFLRRVPSGNITTAFPRGRARRPSRSPPRRPRLAGRGTRRPIVRSSRAGTRRAPTSP